MPSSKNYKRNYKREYETAKRRGEVGTGSDSHNAKRKRDRRAMENKLGRKLATGEEVDHIKPINHGGKAGKGDMDNLRIRKRGENRSFKRNADGSIKRRK